MSLAGLRSSLFRPNSSVSHVFTLLSWVTISQAVSFGMMLVLARLYRPAQFGLFSLFTNASVMIGVVAALRYEYAIVLPRENKEAVSIVWLGLLTACAIALTTLIGGLVWGNSLAEIARAGELAPWFGWLALAVLLLAAYNLCVYWALRSKAYTPLGISRLVIALATALVQLIVAVAIAPLTGALIGDTNCVALLKELGDGYKFDIVTEKQLLAREKKLSDYDVLFLTCAGGGEQLKDDLRDFVANGGVLYASDWRYDAVAMAFPEMVEDKLRDAGGKQELNAQVVDPALRDVIGDSIHLNFDMAEWKTAAFGGPRVKTLIKGRYEIDRKKGQYAVAPLMVKKKKLMAIMGEEETGSTSSCYWDGKKYKWDEGVSSK